MNGSAREISRVFERGPDCAGVQSRIRLAQRSVRHARGKVRKDNRDGYSRAFDAGPSMAYVGICGDVSAPVHRQCLVVYRWKVEDAAC